MAQKSLKNKLAERPYVPPEALTGTYLEHMGYKPNEEGVTILPKQLYDIAQGETLHPSGGIGTAFAPYPDMQYSYGMRPEQQAFINEEEALRMSENNPNMDYNDVVQYLSGHELYHSNNLTPYGSPVGNKGYQAGYNARKEFPTKHGSTEIKRGVWGGEGVPLGRENWLNMGYSAPETEGERNMSDYKWWKGIKPQERGASVAGIKRMMEKRSAK